ncbi:hypothetical protein K9L67_01615 [Candidatus Woesearchaeota archaeon]|nr:hypothetical protein [Candidatus Woesearchaeota archaeon]MCF7900901.1 hypothetical protein [Candidatus Woesearchaeota archaeon]MCF8013050.1 hypothetical protein [Candidatus Woesearchaeota archaeon]
MKKITITILLLILLIVSGCGGNVKANLPNQYVGTEGLTIKYWDNMPPKEVYEDQEIILGYEVKNKGATSLNETDIYGTITIKHNEPYLEPKEKIQQKFYLHGKSLDYPIGESLFVEGAAYKIQRLIGQDQTFFATITSSLCYPYKTTLTETICVDTDFQNSEYQPICKNQKMYNYKSGQGAPIAITKMEVAMLPQSIKETDLGTFNVINEIAFGNTNPTTEIIKGNNFAIRPQIKLTIENKQKGFPLIDTQSITNLLKTFGGQACENEETQGLNQVYVKAKLGNYELKCLPELLHLGKNKELTCTLKPEDITYINQNYLIPLTVEIYYNYQQTFKKAIQINRLPEVVRTDPYQLP